MQIGFPGLLTLIFITLKLTDYIDWSWVWVLSPMWISISLAVIIAIFIISMGGTVNRVRK